jgi:type II secretory pathway pseudopilin PulG
LKAIGKKLKKNSRGFSLAETLICILILLMVSAIVGAAIPTASNVFVKTVDAANAQVVLSTAMTALRDELGTATQVKKEADGSLVYKSSTFGWCKLEFGTFNMPVGGAASSGGDTPVSGETTTPAPKTVAVTGIMVTYGGTEEEVTDSETGTKSFVITFPTDLTGKQRLLVSKEAITENLKLEGSVSAPDANGVVTFELKVTKDTTILAQRASYKVRTMK